MKLIKLLLYSSERNFIRVTIDIYPANYIDDKSNTASPVQIKAPETAPKAPLIAPEMAPKAPLIAPKPIDTQRVHVVNKHNDKPVDAAYDASSSDTDYDPKIENDMLLFTSKRKKNKKIC